MVETTKVKKEKKFTVCTSEARYVKPLLQHIIAEKGWKETLSKDKFNLKWFQFKIEDQECKIICHK